MVYSVKYKRLKWLSSWKKLKRVKGDGLMENGLNRFFILEDETRIEIPIQHYVFQFSKERFYSVKERLDEEAGQPVQVKKR
ncbi:hypothetical protein LCGC14_2757260 [marine sediment metagenome]|uniref:Uncharacterized protein n=1 Tax=marine sediment metagenome TaxID=412755 RepID=A0A0F8Z006_9ZZZZ